MLRLINNSPVVSGDSVSLEYLVGGLVDMVVGQLAGVTFTQPSM